MGQYAPLAAAVHVQWSVGDRGTSGRSLYALRALRAWESCNNCSFREKAKTKLEGYGTHCTCDSAMLSSSLLPSVSSVCETFWCHRRAAPLYACCYPPYLAPRCPFQPQNSRILSATLYISIHRIHSQSNLASTPRPTPLTTSYPPLKHSKGGK